AAGSVRASERNVGRRLERRIAAEIDRVTHAEAGIEAAPADANYGLLIQTIRETHARLNLIPPNFREVVGIRPPSMEIVERSGGSFRETSLAGIRKRAARNHYPIVTVAARRNDHGALNRVDRHRFARIVKHRI